jgi:transposase-like protein
MPLRNRHQPPPFCPNPLCDSRTNPAAWHYKKKGFFFRSQKPYRVQRYVCQHCRRNFSSQTFQTSYWLRRAELLAPVFHRLLACSGLRQIARECNSSHSTIQRMSERLGRHCLLFHEMRRPREGPREPIVLDGFRTFEHSQYWPLDLNLVIGPSHFVYGFNDAELRRSGTMRPSQKRKRERLETSYGRPDPQATRKSVEALLQHVTSPLQRVILRSDEHPAYIQAVNRIRNRVIRHETTPSRAPRTTGNPLFPVNLADLLLRHSSANHKRETIAFSKRRQGILYRAAIWVVWRNYIKCCSENRRDAPPAQNLGMIDRALTVADVLRQRLFPDRVVLSPWLSSCYFAQIKTRAIEHCKAHQARYAR